MTREEAIKLLTQYIDYDAETPDYYEMEKACKVALKALSAEPCEDCVSREEVCDYIAEFVNHEYATDREHEMVEHIIGGIQHLPSIQPKTDVLDTIRAEISEIPTISFDNDVYKADILEIIDKYRAERLEQEPTTKENLVVGDCISREFIEIVVEYPPADLCTYPEYKGKPYFSIKYRENGNGYVGFGTYKIEMLSQWIKEYFMPSIQPKTKTDEPMQVELEGDGYADGELVYDYGKCPKCGWEFEYGEKDWEEPYCCHCGQRLKWFESEE